MALAAVSVGTAAALVGMASFALFTSTATAQTDTFAAGTVTLAQTTALPPCTIGSPSGSDATGLSSAAGNLEPGDSGSCTYQVTYGGSLNAWVGLSVYASSVAMATYTPGGSVTPIGGEALLGEGGAAGADAGNALQVTLTDSLGNSGLTLPQVTCPNTDSTATGSAEGSGAFGTASACNGAATYLLNDGGTAGPYTNDNPAGSWTTGTVDTVTLNWHLPLSAPNAYQGSSAQIVLQAQAVQASNNALVNGQPTSGWSGPAQAPKTPELDQSDTAAQVGMAEVFNVPSQVALSAQTFVAGITGSLSKLTLDGLTQGTPGNLIIQIETLNGSGLPSGTVIGSGSAPSSTFSTPTYSYKTITLSQPAPVVAGQHYAFVLSAPPSPASVPRPLYHFAFAGGGTYSSGAGYTGAPPWGELRFGDDFQFETWVVPS